MRGILRDAELSKVEKGKMEIDRMHLEVLFQRIGKSVDKLELRCLWMNTGYLRCDLIFWKPFL